MLTSLGRWARREADATDPFTNVVGLARTLLAASTALTLTFSHSTSLFRPAVGVSSVPQCGGLRSAGVFCIAGGDHLEIARWLCVLALVVVASGYRPRFTGLLHWWISVSLQMNGLMVDGGDQVVAVLTLLLVPVTLVDPRRWHWGRVDAAPTPWRTRGRMIALGALALVRLQVCGIYFHAAVAKFAVPEWTDGTSIYYWLGDPSLGAPHWLAPLLRPVLTSSLVALVTWGVLVLEYALGAGLIVAKKHRPALLVMGIALHSGIVVVHGLVSFGLAMFAALLLYLHPVDRPLALPALSRARARLVARTAT